jgi:hypothetical protein
MSVVAELADGRRLEFPDGTDPSVVQATVKKMLAPPATETGFALNSINKGIAGIPDSLLNAPNRVANLVKAAVGTAAGAMGHPEMEPTPSPDPDIVSKLFQKAGFIKPDVQPQNARQRIEDAMLQGGVGGATSPANGVGGVVANVVKGLLAGGAGGATKEATGSEPLAIAASMGAPAAVNAMRPTPRPMNDVERGTLKAAQAAGYVTPPAEIAPNFINKRLQSIAGKDATNQETVNRNQDVTNQLAATDLGLPKNTPITVSALETVRKDAAKPYREIAALSPTAASALEELKQARYDFNVHNTHYQRSADPAALQKAKVAQQDMQTWENVIDQEAVKSGVPDLPQRLAEGRTLIAKSYDVERSLNEANAEVSAPALGNAYGRGKPLSGGLETAAKFQQAFPRYAREGASNPTPGVSKAEAVASAILGTIGLGSGGPGRAVAAGGLPLLSGPTRSLILSKPYQQIMAPLEAPAPQTPQDQVARALFATRAFADR